MAALGTCPLHPGIAVTGFCAACLAARLAVLSSTSANPPSSSSSSASDLRRCKSFTVRRADVAPDPHRRSCDVRDSLPTLFHHHYRDATATTAAAAGGAATVFDGGDDKFLEPESRKPSWIAGSAFGKKWQDWRQRHKSKKQQPATAATPPPPPQATIECHRRRPPNHDFAPGRLSCDVVDDRFSFDLPRFSVDEPRASWDGHFRGGGGGGRSALGRIPAMFPAMDLPTTGGVMRSDGLIPVEEDGAVPGGSAQTRDYYLDSSSRRRPSFERSARRSSADANDLKPIINANAKVSPTGNGEFYHYNHAAVNSGSYHYQPAYSGPQLLRDDDSSHSFNSAFWEKSNGSGIVPETKPKKWIKGWNFLGLLQKKGSGGRKDDTARRQCPLPDYSATHSNGTESTRHSYSNAAWSSAAGHQQDRKAGRELPPMPVLDRSWSARYPPNQLGVGVMPTKGSRGDGQFLKRGASGRVR